jgi:hypothetical protein
MPETPKETTMKDLITRWQQPFLRWVVPVFIVVLITGAGPVDRNLKALEDGLLYQLQDEINPGYKGVAPRTYNHYDFSFDKVTEKGGELVVNVWIKPDKKKMEIARLKVFRHDDRITVEGRGWRGIDARRFAEGFIGEHLEAHIRRRLSQPIQTHFLQRLNQETNGAFRGGVRFLEPPQREDGYRQFMLTLKGQDSESVSRVLCRVNLRNMQVEASGVLVNGADGWQTAAALVETLNAKAAEAKKTPVTAYGQ